MHKELLPYFSLVEFFSNTFGPDYEVALHNFTPTDSSIVAIANGHISGRRIGAPLNKKSLSAIKKGFYKNQNFISDYASVSSNGKVLRSNTYFIKDKNNELIGLLCINFDDTRYRNIMNSVMELCHPNNFIEQKYVYKDTGIVTDEKFSEDLENFHTTMEGTVDEALSKITANKLVPVERLTVKEKMEIIAKLQESGIFFIRGAVKYVSKRLKCSQATMYRYLKNSKIKNLPENNSDI